MGPTRPTGDFGQSPKRVPCLGWIVRAFPVLERNDGSRCRRTQSSSHRSPAPRSLKSGVWILFLSLVFVVRQALAEPGLSKSPNSERAEDSQQRIGSFDPPGLGELSVFGLPDALIAQPTWPQSKDWQGGSFLKLVEDQEDQKGGPSEPDINKPGPDFGDYPNSAYTLPKGRAYVEVEPVSYQGKDRNNSASISSSYLLRYGVTDDVEFRLTGSGLTSVFDPGGTVTGFAPLLLDTKIHLWDDQISKLIPAASFEAFLQTNLASPNFQSGFQPSINVNLDFPFTKKTNVETTFGYTSVQDSIYIVSGERFVPRFGHNIPTLAKANLNINQFSFQWAIEHQVTEEFQIFLHGYYNGDVFRQSGAGRVVGAGYFYQLSKRAMLFNAYNAGLDENTPNFSTQLGLAFAF